jgi:enoyl-CoA hydratase/carnithine racemase
MISYIMEESAAVVSLESGENRFNPDFLNAFIAVLDEIEARPEARALVVRSVHEKIFCNGLDLDWLGSAIQKGDMEAAKNFFYLLNQFFKRTLTSPLITTAAITGHVFAGGAIWACAFDFRFMRSDRGYFCLPEIDLGIPFLPGMTALLKKAIPMYKLEELHHTGARLTAGECETHHIVRKACGMDTLMDEVLSFAKGLNKSKTVLKEMKKRLYKDVIHALDVEDVPYIESFLSSIGKLSQGIR